MSHFTSTTATPPALTRDELMEELYRRYSPESRGGSRRRRYLAKKYAWIIVVGGATFLKRLVDVLVSALGLIVLSPLFLAVALSIKATDRGPVLFWQKRVGKWGREFDFPKFRSMILNAEAVKAELQASNQHGSTSHTFKMKRDPRVTWIGRILRKLSIDELPQLWCVLYGDMSLVGPRPPLPSEVARYSLSDRRRLDVQPGLTCIWQVSGRGDLPFAKQLELDVAYIESDDPWKDLKLLVRTIPAVLTGRGAY